MQKKNQQICTNNAKNMHRYEKTCRKCATNMQKYAEICKKKVCITFYEKYVQKAKIYAEFFLEICRNATTGNKQKYTILRNIWKYEEKKYMQNYEIS